MRMRTPALIASLLLLGTAVPAAAQWGGGGATMVITLRDGRETRIPVADIGSIRFDGGGGGHAGGGGRPVDWIGSVWEVNEGGWNGVWTRMGDSNKFRAVWRNRDGQEQRDELILESVRGDKVVFFRESKRGRYRITLSPDRTRIANGTADWYRSGDSFEGSIRD